MKLALAFSLGVAISGGLATAAIRPKNPALESAADRRSARQDEPGDSATAQVLPVIGPPQDAWWRAIEDPFLDQLELRALASNQDLRAALARVEQARAAAGLARAELLPSLAADGGVERRRTSATVDNRPAELDTRTYRAPFAFHWELDLFGRARHAHRGALALAQASAADLGATRLALTAEVASNYFVWQAREREIAVLTDTVALRRSGLRLVQARFTRGMAAEVDVARAETELAIVESQLSELRRERASVRHALALLLGETPDAIAPSTPSTEPGDLPDVPGDLPSDLLERRPDVAAAERTLTAAAERIGVARAAFFPAISLTGAAGYASGELDDLLTADSRAWSIGPQLYLPIFQGGRLRADLAQAKGAYDEAVARYHQQVLIAFREVYDALSAVELLAEEASAQERARVSAERGADLAQHRYEAGLVGYLDVVDAGRTALEVKRAGVRLAGRRFVAWVDLVRALGGTWEQETASGTQVSDVR